MKKKIFVVCVNYNSYNDLKIYLNSIDNSFGNVMHLCDIDVYIADNSTIKQELNLSTLNFINPVTVKLDNLGYLGGASAIINKINNIKKYDYVIISNVDLEVDNSFFSTLLSLHPNEKIGWIAPQIYSKPEQRDKNPKVLVRYSKRKLQILQIMYKFPILHKLYELSIYKMKKNRQQYSAMNIYAGHGAFMIFTKSMMNKYTRIDYPVFLFGEELFFAEKALQANLKVRYEPILKIYDKEHVSTAGMKSSLYYKCNLEALSYILSTYYE